MPVEPCYLYFPHDSPTPVFIHHVPPEFQIEGATYPVGEESIELDNTHTFIYNTIADHDDFNLSAMLVGGVEHDEDGDITIPNHRLVSIHGPGLLMAKSIHGIVPLDENFADLAYVKDYILRNMRNHRIEVYGYETDSEE